MLLVSKALNGLVPTYLPNLLLPCEPSRSLRSSGSGLLIGPKVQTKTQGEASLCYFGPRLWNSFPQDLRAGWDINTFKSKACLFSLAFNRIVFYAQHVLFNYRFY